MGTLANSGNINVKIEGGISGQVAIGSNILQIGDVRGGIVNVIQPDKKPTFTPRPQPIVVRPRPFPGFLNRETEISAATDALRIGTSISIYGEEGLGKTSFLRHLSYNFPMDNFPQGVVYFPAHGQTMEDLLQVIFDYFYKSDTTAKPTDAELRQFLQNIHALILLDNVPLNYDEITELINAAPQCVFALASSVRCLWGEGYCIELHGLPIQSARSLIERELNRPLSAEEQADADALCQIVSGRPLLLIQAAAQVRAGKPIKEITRILQTSENELGNDIASKLNGFQRAILGILGVFKNTPVPIKHLSVLTQSKDFDAQLKTLLDLRLIQAHSPSVSLAGSMGLSLGQLSAADWESQVLNYFIQWIKQNPPLPEITDVLDLILSLLEKSNRDGRWDNVITLGKGIEKALVLNKRWHSWRQVLQWILKAAQSLGDQGTQAWALHELGTRSLCMGDLPSARESLTQALDIRNFLGDKAGAEVTRHNLGLIGAPPAPPHKSSRSASKPAHAKGMPFALKAILGLLGLMIVSIVVIVLLLLWLFLYQPPPVPPVIETATKQSAPLVVAPTKTPIKKKTTPTPAPTKTFRPTPTKTFSPTPTKTFSPTPTIPPCSPGVWYCENFDDNKAQDWKLDSGWSIQRDGNGYILEGNGHKFASYWEQAWDDYRVAFRLRLFGGGIHAIYRLSPGNNNLIRYYIGFDENGTYLTRQVNDQFTELRWIDWSLPLGEWHNIEIAGWEGHLAVYVDKKLILEHVDEDYLRKGSIAFETLDYSNAQIDDIEVMGPGTEPVVVISPDILPISCTSYYMTWEQGFDRPGFDYWSGKYIGDPDSLTPVSPINDEMCQNMCLNDSSCKAFTYDYNLGQCWLKNGQSEAVYKAEDVSGIKVCQ